MLTHSHHVYHYSGRHFEFNVGGQDVNGQPVFLNVISGILDTQQILTAFLVLINKIKRKKKMLFLFLKNTLLYRKK